MDNYNWTSFTKKIAIKSSLSEIYDAWTIPQEIEKWFLSKAIYTRTIGNSVERNQSIQKGDSYQWFWFLYDDIEKGKIIEANGKDLLKFRFLGDSLVQVKLSQKGEYIILELTQSNIPTDNQSKRDIRIGCDSGWSFYLLNLKSFYEGGIDLRNKNESLKGMVNN